MKSGMTRMYALSIAFVVLFISAPAAYAQAVAAVETKAQAKQPAAQPESLTAAEFSRLSREMSEEGGFFRSDNFTSNETAYLSVVDKLRELGATGGAYLGVGPEQNFTYIAKIRPRIADVIFEGDQPVILHDDKQDRQQEDRTDHNCDWGCVKHGMVP